MTLRRAPVRKLTASGFTLPELVITIAIAAILAAIAAPSFTSLIAGQRIRTASFDLVANLMLARSEAIKQNGNVTITSASGTDAWANGWAISSPSGTIKSQAAYSKLTITSASGASLVYNRSGRVDSGAAATFEISDAASGSSVPHSCVTVGVTGQPTSRKGSC
jgi:type IV fimbrial biogenesis protein FimT